MQKEFIPEVSPQFIEAEKPVSSDEVYANVIQEERVRNLLAQSSPDNQLLEIQYRIKGYIKDPVSGMWRKIDQNTPEPHPMLVARFISYLSALLNDNTRWSNLSGDEINAIMSMAIEWVADDLDSHSDEYGLANNYSERTRIGHILLSSAFIGLKRALDGSEVRRIFGSLSMIENNNQSQKAEGFMDKLKALIR